MSGEPEVALGSIFAGMWRIGHVLGHFTEIVSRIRLPFSSTLIVGPITVTSWKFHWPAGRRKPLAAGAIP